MTWCHHYQMTLRARHIPGCLNVMVDLLSRLNQVPINRMITASVGVQTDLSKVIHSSHRSICHSSEPQSSTVCISSPRPKCLGHKCSKHKQVGSRCLCLPSHISFSQGGPKDQAMQLPDHHNSPRLARAALVLGPSAAPTEIPLQLLVSTTLLKQSHNYVFHSNPQHLNLHAWCLRRRLLCGGGRENCCPSKVINKDNLQVKVGLI